MGCKALIPYFSMTLTSTSGRFQWVYCQLSYLENCLPGRIRHALDELPATLDATYERTLREINDLNWEFARRLLQCVAVVSRPLRVEELAEFLAFDFSAGPIPKFREDWRLEDPLEAVLSTCSTLLSLVDFNNTQVIQFSHFSVKEFLTSARFAEKRNTISHRYHVSLTPAHTLVAQAFLGILLHLDPNVNRDSLEKFPLAGYAAEHWFEHARFEGVSQNVEEATKQLFNLNKPHLMIWVWIRDPIQPFLLFERPLPCQRTPLHYAAYCGFLAIVKVLVINHSQDVDSRAFKHEWTPLYLASAKGHVEVARWLIEHGASVTAQDKGGLTPLHGPSALSRVEVVRLLIEHGADVTAKDKGGSTPLHAASDLRRVDVARLLVEHGAD